MTEMRECNKYKEVKLWKYGEFFVEIRVSQYEYEAWIQHKDCGIMSLLFGMPKEQPDRRITYGQFKEMVANNLDEYIESYREEYMND